MIDIKPSGDIYASPQEVVWKSIVFPQYQQFMDSLSPEILENAAVRKEIVSFTNLFNSEYDLERFCQRYEVIQRRLTDVLRGIEAHEVIAQLTEITRTTQESIRSVLAFLPESMFTTPDVTGITHITDGGILIRGESLEEFAAEPDYLRAVRKLLGIREDMDIEASQHFFEGFYLEDSERKIIEKAKQEGWEAVDLVISVLQEFQIRKKLPSLIEFQHNPSARPQENEVRKMQLAQQAFLLTGKLFSAVARFSNASAEGDFSPNSDNPVAAFLQAAGLKHLTERQIAAVQKIALAHSSHGLNSGELAATFAGSVRTTFPHALIASFAIRSGVTHTGALQKCMEQTERFLDSGKDAGEFLETEAGLLYGFGHRIHKISPHASPEERLGQDPRVRFYIETTREAFPERNEVVEKLVAYAQAARAKKTSLGANTDFGATVLFHALGIPDKAGMGAFFAFRVPGLCARIIEESTIKANSRRPPFAPVIPYLS